MKSESDEKPSHHGAQKFKTSALASYEHDPTSNTHARTHAHESSDYLHQ